MRIIRLITSGMFVVFFTTNLTAQTNKQIEKATKLFYKDHDKGIAKLRKYMAKAEQPSLSAYEVLVKMEFMDYDQSMAVWESIDINVKDEDSKINDSTMQALVNRFKEEKKQHFLDVCRMSTLESYSYSGEIYLRIMTVDYTPDTLVSDQALKFFNEGERYFASKQYESAQKEYRKALTADSTFYKATLYLGDTYWILENPDSALFYYELARDMHPDLLEPRKYIVDALTDQGLYYRAKKECIDAICIYPGLDMKLKLLKILEIENKRLNDRRFLRAFFPNNPNTNQGELSGVWADYRKAKSEVSRYTNEEGIIEDNGVTKDKYLEVYSFRRMLDENVDKELPGELQFALKMKEEGYLEPYVFISMFHVDIYPQLRHYMSIEENVEKSKDYIEKYLIERIPN
jgi:tetratricopeptide (TPR) repeat protein